MGDPPTDEPRASSRSPSQWGNVVGTLVGLAWFTAGMLWTYEHREAIGVRISAALARPKSLIVAAASSGPTALDIEDVGQARDDVYRSSGCICGDDAVYGPDCGPLGSIACMPYYCMRCARLGRGCELARKMPCRALEAGGK